MTVAAGGLLEELKQAHERILARLNALAVLTDREDPDGAELSALRYSLSRASGARRRLLGDQVYPLLLARVTGTDAGAVRKLHEKGAVSVTASSSHIHRWTIDAALNDWAGYRAASVQMRSAMRSRIDEEQRVLYPLLRTCG